MIIRPTKPQADFLRLQCLYPLFVAGLGSGKSYSLLISAMQDLFSFRGAIVAVYSDTYDQLRLNLVPRFEEMFTEAGVAYSYNKSENIMHVADGGMLILRSIDNPKRIIGYEVFRSHVDEMEATTTEEKAEMAWTRICSRTRQMHPEIEALRLKGGDELEYMRANPHTMNRVSAYTTPDQGFGWSYKKWGQSESLDYQFVTATTESNKHLPPNYADNLRATYGDDLAEAFIEGKWCNLTSGAVYSAFDRDLCHTDRIIRTGEPLHIGMDFNVRNMAAVTFVNDEAITSAVDELIGYADTPAMIEAIRERYKGHRIYIYPDATGRKTTSSGGASMSDISLLKDAGFHVLAKASNPRVRDRIVCNNRRMADGTVKVNTTTCPQVTECRERQAYDKNGVPDKDSGFDHANDAFDYRVIYSFPLNVSAFTTGQKRYAQ